LIIATHGLGIQIIDDISSFRDLTPEILNAKAAVLSSRDSIMETPFLSQEFPGDAVYFGENPPSGASITYYLKKRHIFGSMKLEIMDADGGVIKTLPTTKNRGLNRVFWNMRLKRPKTANAPGLSFNITTGPMVPEGTYTVRLVKGKEVYTGKLKLVPNPVSAHIAKDRHERYEAVLKVYDMQGDLGFLADNVQGLMDQIDTILKTAKKKNVKSKLKNYKSELEAYHKSIVNREGVMAGEKLREKVMGLYSSIIQYGGKPTDSQLFYLSVLKDRIRVAGIKYESVVKKVPSVNKVLKGTSHKPLKLMTRKEYDKKD
jgi:hypothetical protein